MVRLAQRIRVVGTARTRFEARTRPHDPAIAEANRVPVDRRHTVTEVERQMAYLRDRRGPSQFVQLIGGEVSLLPPDDHAEAVAVMRRYDRIPMSFSHGDVDEDHLEAVVLDADGQPRFDHVAFAIDVDSTMRGRQGHRTPPTKRSCTGSGPGSRPCSAGSIVGTVSAATWLTA